MINYKSIETNCNWKSGIIILKEADSLLVRSLSTGKYTICPLYEIKKEKISNVVELFSYLRKKVHARKNTPMIMDQDALYSFEQLYN